MTANLFDAILAQVQGKKKTEKQQKVLEAAIRLFAEKGYANTSTAEIAQAAGVSEGTIFKHYGTKDRLLLSILVPFIRELFPQMMKELVREIFSEQTTFEQCLRAFVRNRVDFLSENRDIFRVMFRELIYNDELRIELLSNAMAHVHSELKQVVNHFIQKGELADRPAETVMNLIATFLSGFFVSRILLMNRATIGEDEIEEAVQFIMNGIENKDKVGGHPDGRHRNRTVDEGLRP